MDTKTKATQIVDQMMAKDWFSQWLGIEVISVEEGQAKLKMTVRRDMLNGFGILHGGVAFSLADSALAFAANGQGQISVSIEAGISYIQSATEGELITAKASQISDSRRIAIYQVLITNASDQTLCHFKGTIYRTSKTH